MIENVKYVALDVSGNKFEIEAKKGTTNSRNYDEIFLKDVVATIWLYNSEKIIITSSLANYNKNSVETEFEDNVEINYINHKINSNKLLLSFKDKIATITKDVIYKGNNTNLYTDNIEIDFKTKQGEDCLVRHATRLFALIEEKYKYQMAVYRQAMLQVYPSHQIKCFLLWTNIPMLMEIPSGLLDESIFSNI